MQKIELTSFRKSRSYSLPVEPQSLNSIENTSTQKELKCVSAEKDDSRFLKICKPFIGFFYISMTAICLLSSSVIVKQLSHVSPGQLSLIRFVATFFGCLTIAIYSVRDVFGRKKDIALLNVRGLMCATGFYLYFISFKYLPMAEASIIMSTSPAVTAVIARLYLKERIGIVQGLALVITLFGTLVSLRLPLILKTHKSVQMDYFYVCGLIASAACVLIQSFNVIIVRKMKNIHFSVFTLYLSLTGMIENVVVNYFTAEYELPRNGWDRLLFILMGVLGLMGSCFTTLGIRSELAAISTILRAGLDIIFAMIMQLIFFHVIPDVYVSIGSFLVIIALIIIGFRKWILSLPEESNSRKRLHFLLL